MKKSLLSILIALVLIVALVPVIASAETTEAGWYFGSTACKIAPGGAAQYFTTDADGVVTAGADEDTYNVKVEYPATEGANPIITLRGAYISGTYRSIGNDAQPADTVKTPLTIIVEETDAGTVTVGTDSVEADSYLGNILNWSGGALEIQGPGLLKMGSSISAGVSVTFKNADFDMDIPTSAGNKTCITSPSITFDGGKVKLQTGYAAILDTSSIEKTIKVQGNADVSITSVSNAALYITNSKASFVIDSGNVKIESKAQNAYEFPNAIILNGGTLEIIAKPGSNCNSKAAGIDLSNYNGSPVGTATWATGAGGATTSLGTSSPLSWFGYVYVEPGFAVTANNGAAYLHDNPNNVQTAAAPGQTVGLKCEESSAAYEFEGWVVDDGSTEVTITDADKTTASFVMPEGNVSVTAKYKKLTADATVKIDGTDYTVDQGGDAVYFKTDDAGAITVDGDEDTYNVKLAYPEGEDAVPTLYLKGATIGFPINSVKSDKFIIKVETDSTQGGANAMITWSHGELIVEGSEGAKYTIDSEKTAFKLVGSPITFKNLDLTANITADWNYLIGGNPKLITFSGGKADITATLACIFNADAANEDMEGLVVTDNADVKMGGPGSAIYWDVKNASITVNSGKLHMYTTKSGGTPFRLASCKFIINGGSVELDGAIASYPYTIVPDLSGYQGNYTAVTGEKDGLIPYDPEDGFGQGVDGGYRGYWKIEPAEAGHQCSLKMVKGKAASCTTDGEKFYYGCEECGAAYEDNLGEKPIEDIDTWKVIKAFGHADDDKDGKCDVCQAVQTSDSSFTALWIAVLALSVLGFCVIFVYNKKMKAA